MSHPTKKTDDAATAAAGGGGKENPQGTPSAGGIVCNNNSDGLGFGPSANAAAGTGASSSTGAKTGAKIISKTKTGTEFAAKEADEASFNVVAQAHPAPTATASIPAEASSTAARQYPPIVLAAPTRPPASASGADVSGPAFENNGAR